MAVPLKSATTSELMEASECKGLVLHIENNDERGTIGPERTPNLRGRDSKSDQGDETEEGDGELEEIASTDEVQYGNDHDHISHRRCESFDTESDQTSLSPLFRLLPPARPASCYSDEDGSFSDGVTDDPGDGNDDLLSGGRHIEDLQSRCMRDDVVDLGQKKERESRLAKLVRWIFCLG